MEIRPIRPGDDAALAWFLQRIPEADRTFLKEDVTDPEVVVRWSQPGDARSVAVEDGEVVGWAALSPASARRCYAGVAENSVYVAHDARGLGIGRALLERLIKGARAAGIWTIQTSIFPENRASLALHERCGFRVVGTRERIARRDGIWRDTVFLERRL